MDFLSELTSRQEKRSSSIEREEYARNLDAALFLKSDNNISFSAPAQCLKIPQKVAFNIASEASFL